MPESLPESTLPIHPVYSSGHVYHIHRQGARVVFRRTARGRDCVAGAFWKHAFPPVLRTETPARPALVRRTRYGNVPANKWLKERRYRQG